MNHTFNKILLVFSSLALVSLLFTISRINFSRDYIIVLFYLFFILASFFAIISVKRLVLACLAILPTIIIFHNIKINLGIISPLLRNISLPANFTSLVAVFLIYLAAVTIISNFPAFKKIPLKSAIFPYFAFILLSFLWTSNVSASLVGLIYALSPLAVYILTNIHFKTEDDLMAIWLTVIGSSLGPVLISVWQIATSNFYYEADSSLARINGSFVHPNLLGLYLFIIISLLVTFYFALAKDSRLNSKISIYGAILALMFVLTFSRTSWLCAAIFILLFATLKKQLFTLVALAAPVALFFSVFIEQLRDRIWGLSDYIFFNSVIARQNIWRVSMGEFADQPIIGHGIGSSESVIAGAKEWAGGTSLPHNDYILHALEFGVIGLLLYLNYILQTIKRLYSAYRDTPDKYSHLAFGGVSFDINLKTLAFGAFTIFIALQGATMFESVSREIILQIAAWAIIGGLLAQQKKPA
jgi:O-antigen ligase